MMGAACIFFLVLLGGPLLLLVGLIGQRNPAMPRCRSCRAALTASAAIPAQCPSCASSLDGPRAVGFGGWRPKWSSLLVGTLLLLLAGGFFAFATMRAVPGGVRMVNNVMIERSVSLARFEQRTQTLDESALEWVRVHLTHGDLSPDLARRAASLLIDQIGSDDRTASQALHALSQATGAYEPRDLAAALMRAVVGDEEQPAVRLTARAAPGVGELNIVIESPVGSHIFLNAPIWLGVAILDVRIDGTRVDPLRPRGRAGWIVDTHTATFADPRRLSPDAERIEVDLVVIAFDHAPPGFVRGLPGPPDQWPPALAERRVTLEAVRTRR